MTDLYLIAGWTSLLGAALAAALVLRSLGLATTYVRDMLHIGAGTWVLGWLWWSSPLAPISLAVFATIAMSSIPYLATHLPVAARFRRSVTDDDERFAGLAVYTASFAVFTLLGLCVTPFPAAAALLALSLGDGVGGAVGRRWGRHHYRTPFGKRKSLEGSTAVALAAALGVALAAALFSVDLGPGGIVALAGVAAVSEGIAPRSSDNAFVPATVWLTATLMTG